ncbi:MAG: META domain-containing protein [Bradymonadia bacterium]
MRPSLTLATLLLALSTLITTANAEAPAGKDMLGGWALAEIDGRDALPGTTLWLEYAVMGGRSGCNAYGGNYQHTGGKLTVGSVSSTLRACLDEARMKQEGDYLRNLRSASEVSIDNGRLELRGGTGTLVFTRQQAEPPRSTMSDMSIELRDWKLMTLVDGAPRSPIKGHDVTLRFQGGKVTGHLGCHDATGTYVLEGNRMRLRVTTTTDGACTDGAEDQLRMRQEVVLEDILNTHRGHTLEDGVLAITDAKERVLRFQQAY